MQICSLWKFSLLPVREVENGMDVLLGTVPISRALYWMAPLEVRELRTHLRLGNSGPWGAPDLFLRKKDGNIILCIDY